MSAKPWLHELCRTQANLAEGNKKRRLHSLRFASFKRRRLAKISRDDVGILVLMYAHNLLSALKKRRNPSRYSGVKNGNCLSEAQPNEFCRLDGMSVMDRLFFTCRTLSFCNFFFVCSKKKLQKGCPAACTAHGLMEVNNMSLHGFMLILLSKFRCPLYSAYFGADLIISKFCKIKTFRNTVLCNIF